MTDNGNPKELAMQGEDALKKGNYDEAVGKFTEAIKLTGGEEGSKYAWAFAHRGQVYILQKDYDKAEADLSKAIKLTGGEEKSEYAWAFAHRGAARYFKNEYDSAEKDLTKATKEKYAWAYAYRAQVYIKQGQSEEAKNSYQEAMKLYRAAFLDIYTAIAFEPTLYIKSLEVRKLLPSQFQSDSGLLSDLHDLLNSFNEVDRLRDLE